MTEKVIKNKWDIRIKWNANGSIKRCNSRLLEKCYIQQESINCEETFSRVVRFASIYLILAIVVCMNLELHQKNIKSAFLNGGLKKDIYIEQPKSFITEGQEDRVCKLLRSMYGLKQSFRQRYLYFHEYVFLHGFQMAKE